MPPTESDTLDSQAAFCQRQVLEQMPLPNAAQGSLERPHAKAREKHHARDRKNR